MLVFLYILIIIGGIATGSFLNICIYHILYQERLANDCHPCDSQFRWFDIIPIVSYMSMGQRCKHDRQRMMIQYLLVELLNMIVWLITFYRLDFTLDAIIISLMNSGLIVLSIIDFKTYEIPFGINIYLGCLGIIREMIHGIDWMIITDFFVVSGFIGIIYWITKGNGIGGGDVKLMAAAGLLLGWKGAVIALLIGCICGIVIHSFRMKLTREGHVLAMGPYLSVGMAMTAWFMDEFISCYLQLV